MCERLAATRDPVLLSVGQLQCAKATTRPLNRSRSCSAKWCLLGKGNDVFRSWSLPRFHSRSADGAAEPFCGARRHLWFAILRPRDRIGFDITNLRLSLVLGGILVVPAIVSGVWPNLSHPLSIGTAVFLSLGLMAQIGAVDQAIGWYWGRLLARLAVVCLLTVSLTTTPQRLIRVLAVVSGSLGFFAAKAGLVSAIAGGVRYGDGLSGAFFDNNGYALGTVMIMPMLLAVGFNADVLFEGRWSWLNAWARRGFLLAVPLMCPDGHQHLLPRRVPRHGCRNRYIHGAAPPSCQAFSRLAAILVLGLIVAPIPEGYLERLETIRHVRRSGRDVGHQPYVLLGGGGRHGLSEPVWRRVAELRGGLRYVRSDLWPVRIASRRAQQPLAGPSRARLRRRLRVGDALRDRRLVRVLSAAPGAASGPSTARQDSVVDRPELPAGVDGGVPGGWKLSLSRAERSHVGHLRTCGRPRSSGTEAGNSSIAGRRIPDRCTNIRPPTGQGLAAVRRRFATSARDRLMNTPAASVLQVVLTLGMGGTERLVVQLCQRLRERFRLAVCTLDEPGVWATHLSSAGIDIIPLARRPGFRPELGYRIAQVARQRGVKVIHCHHYSPFVYGLIATLVSPGLRMVFTEHGRLSDGPPSPKRRLVNPLLGRLPGEHFAVSNALKDSMAAEGFPASRITVIPNGIDPGPSPR